MCFFALPWADTHGYSSSVPPGQLEAVPKVFGLYGFAKADAQTTLPAKVPANMKNIQLLREAYQSL